MIKEEKQKIIQKLKYCKNGNRISKTFVPKYLVKTQVVNFYRSVIKNKFNMQFDKQFYLIIHKVMQFYRYQLCKKNNIDYVDYCNGLRYQLNKMQINWNIMSPLWTFCFIGYNLSIDKDLMQNIIKYVYENISGKQNFYIGE